MRLRLQAFDLYGHRRGIVQPAKLTLQRVLCDVPTARITWPNIGVFADRMAGAVEVAVEINHGDGWSELTDGRLRISRNSIDRNRAQQLATANFVGIASSLMDATVWTPTDGDEDGKRVFKSATAGYILRQLFVEAMGRRSANSLQWTHGMLRLPIDGTTDAANAKWSEARGHRYATVAFDPAMTLLDVADWLTRKGMIEWRFSGRTWQVYIADTALAPRRTEAVMRNAFATAVPVDIDYTNIITDGRFHGDEGVTFDRAVTDVVRDFGRIERHTQQGQVANESTANLYLDELTIAGKRPALQYRREWTDGQHVAMPRLGIDYDLGSWVPIDRYRDDTELRVVESNIELHQDGRITGFETLGTRHQSLIERLSRRTWDLSVGKVGSDSGTPKPPPKKSIVPPTNVLVAATSTWFDGEPNGVATVSWTHPGADKFEVWRQFPAKDLVWRVAATTDSNTVDIGRLAVGGTYNFKVRAVEATGRIGEFSEVVTTTIPVDDEPPAAPSAPKLDQAFAMLHVAWDGTMSLGEQPPPDFSHLEIWVYDQTAGGEARNVGQLTRDIDATWLSAETGHTYVVWFVAVDWAGNKSVQSSTSSLKIEDPLDYPLAESKKYADAKLAELDAKFSPLTGKLSEVEAALQTAHNQIVKNQQDVLAAANIAASKGRVRYLATPPTSADDKNAYTLWIRTTDNAPHRWDGSKWVRITDQAVVDAANAAATAHAEAIKAQQAAAAAQQAADNAWSRADHAVTSANGKNTVTFSSNPPPARATGTVAGDLWFQMAPGGVVVGLWRSDGTWWDPRMIDNQVIANLDVGKLVAGDARVAQAVIDKLWVDGLAAKTIVAEQVIISRDGNLVVDSKFENADLNKQRILAGQRVTKLVEGANAELRPIAGENAYLKLGELARDRESIAPIPITPGRYTFSVDVNSGYGNADVWASTYLTKRDGSVEFVSSSAISSPKGWTWLHYEIEVGADVVSVEPWICAERVDGTPVVWARNIWLKAQIGNALIVNGGILADSLNTKQIWANKIWAGEAIAKVVRADMFEGKSFTGGTFTGPLIQTDPEVNTGVKLTPEGLVAYNSWGQKNFTLDAATGNAKFVGRYQSGRDGEPGIAIIPPSEAGYGDTGIFWSLDASTISSPTPGFWINKFGTAGANQPIVMRGRGDSGLHIIGGLTVQMDDKSLAGNSRFRLHGLPPGTQSANLHIDYAGMAYKVSSARRFKTAIKPVATARAERLLDLQPQTWTDKTQLELHRQAVAARNETGKVPEHLEGCTKLPPRITGLIAEDVEASGLTELITRDADGVVDGVQYDRIAPLLIPLVRAQRDRITQLEAQLEALTARIDALEVK